MTSPAFERFLARLLTDDALRRMFLQDPRSAGAASGLTDEERRAIERIDRAGLRMAADSLAAKRRQRQRRFSKEHP